MKKTSLEYGAITIDTQMFKENGCNFKSGLLYQIHQFNGGFVHVLQTDIVHNELLKHLAHDIKNAEKSINGAIQSAKKHLNIKSKLIDEAHELLKSNKNSQGIALLRLNNFYALVDAKIIRSGELVKLQDLTDMYFNTKAPFEEKSSKKYEFPDAIALLSLENWAEINDTRIIAVSKDKGWMDYSKTSKNIHVIDNLPEAIEYFLPHNKVKEIVTYINDGNVFKDKNHILDEISLAIEDSINTSSIDVNADSDARYEVDDLLLHSFDYKLLDSDDGFLDFHVVSIDSKSIVLSISATISCEFEAGFAFYFYDSIDKENIDIGTVYHSTQVFYNSEIVVTLNGDFKLGVDKIKVTNIYIVQSLFSIDFGYIQADR